MNTNSTSRQLSKAGLLLLAFGVTAAILGSESPTLTSSFFGTASVDGNAVPEGTLITASIGGVELESTSVVTSPEGSSFRIDVPGDVPDTPADEGGVEGETVVFRVGNSAAPETGVWRFGLYQRVDLTAAAGPDLVVAQDDGRDTVQPGESLTYSLTITNESAQGATGVQVTEELPPGVNFIVASDGGSEAGGTVSWPAFDLAGGASVARTVTVELAPSFPAGVESLTLTATVTDDGANGVDPHASNNTAADTDTLDAGPDLAVSKTDGLDEVSPGEDLAYTLTITNAGTQDAGGVTLTDTLPAGVTFFTASDDGIETPPGTVTWPAFDLAVGETALRTIQLRFDGTPGQTQSTTSATATPGNGPDQDPADNTGTDVTDVAQRIDLEVVVVDTLSMVTDLQSLEVSGTVRVDIENLGNGNALPFEISLWEDADGDGVLTGADDLLAQAPAAGGVLAGETASFDLTVAGTVSFRDNVIYAFADSAEGIAELDETNNTGTTAESCIAVPVPEDFAPVIEVSWPADDTNLTAGNSVETMSTPIVVQLTDDNGDGAIDEADTPDVVFVTANLIGGIDPELKLRAIRGDTGRSIWTVDPPVSGFSLAFSLSGLAAGDIDGDGIAEIIVATPEPPLPGLEGFGNRITAYEHTGQRKWVGAYYQTHPTGSTFTNRDNPTIADLEGDGSVEIIVGGNVLRSNGSLRWAGSGGQAYQSAGNNDAVDSGSISIVADLDLDGIQEVVAGNTAYRADGTSYWQAQMDDGYPAVGNFDGDDFPEIVVVARGRVRLHEHDGTLIWGPVDLPGAGAEAGGAPTVADFDKDGKPEIGVAGSTLYTVLETNGDVLWQSNIQDGSSNMTGSTVFDFDGDGFYEVVYRDETHLRIYRGTDGHVLFEDPFSSFTANEEPVVADVDGDGRAEIIVTSDLATQISAPVRTSGLRIYGDANDNWVATRKIWNQHAYHSDNVNDDGTVPAQPARGWLTHTTFRASVQPAGQGAFDAADVTASRLTVDFSAYPSLAFGARIGNAGLTSLPEATPVAFYDGNPDAGGQLIGVAATANTLEPGDFEDLGVAGTSTGFGPATVFVVTGDDGAGAGGRRECRSDNNRHSLAFDTDPVGLLLAMDDGQTAVQPGGVVTYQLAVSNAAGTDRTGVALADVLPPHTVFTGASDGGTEVAGR
ncbi:MAG: DUF11 domain-containing protein [Actinomycetia bacterium]|nr:DUF11 domain-containing protein [Actinomycetes bacterium]